MSLPGKTMKIGGYNYHVSDQGEGDKVAFLVHGMPDDGSCWKYQAPALLKAGYRVVVPDTLGYGGTDRPLEVEAYEVDKIIGHMYEIIDTLGLKDIHLMGHDWGSAIAWPMVLERPELFRKFISMSVGHLKCFAGQAFENYKRAVPAVVDNWYMYIHTQAACEELYMMNDMDFLRRIILCQHPEADVICNAIKETGRIEWLNYDKANPVASWYLAYAKNPEMHPRCKVPTMVIYPEQDMFLWKEQAIETPKFMDAECRIEITQGGHWGMLDHPDDVNKLMLEWFESEPSTARADVKEA